MKVIGFNGSPRKGFNTEQLVNKVLEGARNKGAETKLYNLTKMDISPCRACLACRRDKPCSIKDDMAGIIEEIKSSDAIVIGSPVFMLQMSAQTKAFVDRLFPLVKGDETSNLNPGTKALCLFTQGTPYPEAFKAYFDHNELAIKYFGFDIEKTFVAGGTIKKNDLQQQEKTIKKAVEIGENLVF